MWRKLFYFIIKLFTVFMYVFLIGVSHNIFEFISKHYTVADSGHLMRARELVYIPSILCLCYQNTRHNEKIGVSL
jgi:hypothetical protein